MEMGWGDLNVGGGGGGGGRKEVGGGGGGCRLCSGFVFFFSACLP